MGSQNRLGLVQVTGRGLAERVRHRVRTNAVPEAP